MSQKEVRALIETRLKDWADANDIAVAFENVAFTPTIDPLTNTPAPYLKADLLPAQTQSDDLAGQLRAWIGVMQIMIFVPSGKGPGAAEDLIAQLDDLFPCGSYINGSALNVLIETPLTAGNGFPDEAYYAVATSFQYRADALIS